MIIFKDTKILCSNPRCLKPLYILLRDARLGEEINRKLITPISPQPLLAPEAANTKCIHCKLQINFDRLEFLNGKQVLIKNGKIINV